MMPITGVLIVEDITVDEGCVIIVVKVTVGLAACRQLLIGKAMSLLLICAGINWALMLMVSWCDSALFLVVRLIVRILISLAVVLLEIFGFIIKSKRTIRLVIPSNVGSHGPLCRIRCSLMAGMPFMQRRVTLEGYTKAMVAFEQPMIVRIGYSTTLHVLVRQLL